MALKDLLKGRLTEKQLEKVPSSFDIIGNKEKAVAIMEIPMELRKKEKLVAGALAKQHKNVVSVLCKASPRNGIYRTRELKLVAGKKDTEVIHAESGCRFLLDPKKVYFSPREVTERMRIAEHVKEGEAVMVFFAGIGAFPIIIAKKAKPKMVVGIEINPAAVEYFRKNIVLNKVGVEAVLGDVSEKAAAFYGTCDRVVMPLPESAIEYLEHAINCLKTKGFIHLYCLCGESSVGDAVRNARAACRKMKRRCGISANKVLPYGPGIFKYRLDINVSE